MFFSVFEVFLHSQHLLGTITLTKPVGNMLSFPDEICILTVLIIRLLKFRNASDIGTNVQQTIRFCKHIIHYFMNLQVQQIYLKDLQLYLKPVTRVTTV